MSLTCAEGLTVIVNETESPSLVTPPFSNIGVTVIVATIGSVVILVAVKFLIAST